MKKIEFDILCHVAENESFNIKDSAKVLFKTVEEVEAAYNALKEGEYVNSNGITSAGQKVLYDHRIDNAIILAAGMSTRFVPLNYEKPKGLLEVKGEVLIERQIRQLKEKGIEEIVVVVGYMKKDSIILKTNMGLF